MLEWDIILYIFLRRKNLSKLRHYRLDLYHIYHYTISVVRFVLNKIPCRNDRMSRISCLREMVNVILEKYN